ncbi:MAG: RNA-binding transcriptional accessory protein [Bacteroidetes bacterium]|nr:RNA-binding transcriptional accessory protein [Bacteroidota bacterium]
MDLKYAPRIADELKLKVHQVENTAKLLMEDATVPFIARYRKELTGSLDEVEITSIRDRLIQLEELDKRREAILKSLAERDLLTEELKGKIDTAETMTVLEDIYLPYKPKKRTRATIAKEKGLEPLALVIFGQNDFDLATEAGKFIDEEKGVKSNEEALAGARDIIAEWVSEDQTAREKMRELFNTKAVMYSKVAKGKDDEGVKYKDYYDWKEPASKSPSHRILAMFRGEKEDMLKVDVMPDEPEAIEILEKNFLKNNNDAGAQVKLAVTDSYKRLLSLSMESEYRAALKAKADEEAIKVFAENLHQLLMAAPLGEKSLMAFDPGFRTGCKVVVLNRQGKLLHNETVYPHTGEGKAAEAARKVLELLKAFGSEVIAIGNGTAGRETEEFVKKILLSQTDEKIKKTPVIMVNESGASIYSASEVAREEFPDYDVTVRGSVSIGRRLMDPLAELVKIDPKSIGVGQYQHDVNQTQLKQKLDDVVVSCVNKVGVEVNTASKQLLTYVSGLGPKLASAIVAYRDSNGPFSSRDELKKIPRLGGKAFEQAAGFLRIRNGKNPLDASAVHPESYHVVERMAEDVGCSVSDLMINPLYQDKVKIEKYVDDKIGLPTLEDIRSELKKPGRDPREKFEAFEFAKGIDKIDDLAPGMKLPGIVTNITNFGAFVDIGVHQDGLVHISEIADGFIKNPADVLKVAQKVTVRVVEVDVPRKRISLSMRMEDKVKVNVKKEKKPAKEDLDTKLKNLMNKFGKK